MHAPHIDDEVNGSSGHRDVWRRFHLLPKTVPGEEVFGEFGYLRCPGMGVPS